MPRRGFKRDVLELLEYQTEDPVAQENFDRLQVYLESQLMLRFEGDLFEITIGSAVTDFAFPHNLGFLPTEIWTTNVKNGVTVSFNYDLTTNENIYITTSGATTIRFFCGSFVNG